MRLQAICDVARRLATVDDSQAMLEVIVHEAERLLGSHGAAIRLLEGDDLVLKACTAPAATLISKTVVKRGEISLLCTFSDQASIAIEKAALLSATRAQAAALEQQHHELTSFVSIVSHDLKMPLVSIEGMSGLLSDEFGPQIGDTGRRYLGRIHANVRQMERLVESLLVLSGIGRKSAQPEIVCLDRLVEDVVAELGERGRIVSIRHDLGTVWAIRTELEQLFGQLVGNAVKFLGTSPSPAVEVGAEDRGDFIECYVRDNGDTVLGAEARE